MFDASQEGAQTRARTSIDLHTRTGIVQVPARMGIRIQCVHFARPIVDTVDLLLLPLINAAIFVLDEEPGFHVHPVHDFPIVGQHIGALLTAHFATRSAPDVDQSLAAETNDRLVVHLQQRRPAQQQYAGEEGGGRKRDEG